MVVKIKVFRILLACICKQTCQVQYGPLTSGEALSIYDSLVSLILRANDVKINNPYKILYTRPAPMRLLAPAARSVRYLSPIEQGHFRAAGKLDTAWLYQSTALRNVIYISISYLRPYL
ncbi:hypothetical protein EVAR_23303_1 [Eumeta japonica]|uniref:Uncharacterized protein n=1 Tax=Eumeta variegata TaxID=151549 RepID=A0A4C1V6D5_EUMVA|nr:hypothetical protein EVAR_23303_1 [Eumeta japonica]